MSIRRRTSGGYQARAMIDGQPARPAATGHRQPSWFAADAFPGAWRVRVRRDR
jgi:hypothetical protein